MRWKVINDGFGLNDSLSEYKPRLATFTNATKETSFPNFAERAINSHEALLEAVKLAFKNLSPKGNIKKDFAGHVTMAALSKIINQTEGK